MKLNIVPARTGIQWVKLGIKTFGKQPLALTGLFFMYTASFSILLLIPVVGFVLALGIVPAATLGLMAATQEAEKGRFPMPTVLISAFRAGKQRLRAMLVLGLLYAGACTIVMTLLPLLVDVPQQQASATTEAMLTPQFQLVLLVGTLLYLPVSLMFWHAPALVHWHGVSPVKSLFFSTVACLRNAKAFLMYALAWVGVVFVAALVITLIATMTSSPQVAAAALMPLGLLITAMFSTSLYFTFRDSFVADGGTDPEQQPPGDEPT
ncbi:MAG: BPSS1780 family membrane protein [Ramlibacter sp.]|nr:BPSS1780 family membrane protein [Ramlibacter sp.]